MNADFNGNIPIPYSEIKQNMQDITGCTNPEVDMHVMASANYIDEKLLDHVYDAKSRKSYKSLYGLNAKKQFAQDALTNESIQFDKTFSEALFGAKASGPDITTRDKVLKANDAVFLKYISNIGKLISLGTQKIAGISRKKSLVNASTMDIGENAEKTKVEIKKVEEHTQFRQAEQKLHDDFSKKTQDERLRFERERQLFEQRFKEEELKIVNDAQREAERIQTSLSSLNTSSDTYNFEKTKLENEYKNTEQYYNNLKAETTKKYEASLSNIQEKYDSTQRTYEEEYNEKIKEYSGEPKSFDNNFKMDLPENNYRYNDAQSQVPFATGYSVSNKLDGQPNNGILGQYMSSAYNNVSTPSYEQRSEQHYEEDNIAKVNKIGENLSHLKESNNESQVNNVHSFNYDADKVYQDTTSNERFSGKLSEQHYEDDKEVIQNNKQNAEKLSRETSEKIGASQTQDTIDKVLNDTAKKIEESGNQNSSEFTANTAKDSYQSFSGNEEFEKLRIPPADGLAMAMTAHYDKQTSASGNVFNNDSQNTFNGDYESNNKGKKGIKNEQEIKQDAEFVLKTRRIYDTTASYGKDFYGHMGQAFELNQDDSFKGTSYGMKFIVPVVKSSATSVRAMALSAKARSQINSFDYDELQKMFKASPNKNSLGFYSEKEASRFSSKTFYNKEERDHFLTMAQKQAASKYGGIYAQKNITLREMANKQKLLESRLASSAMGIKDKAIIEEELKFLKTMIAAKSIKDATSSLKGAGKGVGFAVIALTSSLTDDVGSDMMRFTRRTFALKSAPRRLKSAYKFASKLKLKAKLKPVTDFGKKVIKKPVLKVAKTVAKGANRTSKILHATTRTSRLAGMLSRSTRLAKLTSRLASVGVKIGTKLGIVTVKAGATGAAGAAGAAAGTVTIAGVTVATGGLALIVIVIIAILLCCCCCCCSAGSGYTAYSSVDAFYTTTKGVATSDPETSLAAHSMAFMEYYFDKNYDKFILKGAEEKLKLDGDIQGTQYNGVSYVSGKVNIIEDQNPATFQKYIFLKQPGSIYYADIDGILKYSLSNSSYKYTKSGYSVDSSYVDGNAVKFDHVVTVDTDTNTDVQMSKFRNSKEIIAMASTIMQNDLSVNDASAEGSDASASAFESYCITLWLSSHYCASEKQPEDKGFFQNIGSWLVSAANTIAGWFGGETTNSDLEQIYIDKIKNDEIYLTNITNVFNAEDTDDVNKIVPLNQNGYMAAPAHYLGAPLTISNASSIQTSADNLSGKYFSIESIFSSSSVSTSATFNGNAVKLSSDKTSVPNSLLTFNITADYQTKNYNPQKKVLDDYYAKTEQSLKDDIKGTKSESDAKDLVAKANADWKNRVETITRDEYIETVEHKKGLLFDTKKEAVDKATTIVNNIYTITDTLTSSVCGVYKKSPNNVTNDNAIDKIDAAKYDYTNAIGTKNGNSLNKYVYKNYKFKLNTTFGEPIKANDIYKLEIQGKGTKYFEYERKLLGSNILKEINFIEETEDGQYNDGPVKNGIVIEFHKMPNSPDQGVFSYEIDGQPYSIVLDDKTSYSEKDFLDADLHPTYKTKEFSIDKEATAKEYKLDTVGTAKPEQKYIMLFDNEENLIPSGGVDANTVYTVEFDKLYKQQIICGGHTQLVIQPVILTLSGKKTLFDINIKESEDKDAKNISLKYLTTSFSDKEMKNVWNLESAVGRENVVNVVNIVDKNWAQFYSFKWKKFADEKDGKTITFGNGSVINSKEIFDGRQAYIDPLAKTLAETDKEDKTADEDFEVEFTGDQVINEILPIDQYTLCIQQQLVDNNSNLDTNKDNNINESDYSENQNTNKDKKIASVMNRMERCVLALHTVGKVGYSQANHYYTLDSPLKQYWSFNSALDDKDIGKFLSYGDNYDYGLMYKTDCSGFASYILGWDNAIFTTGSLLNATEIQVDISNTYKATVGKSTDDNKLVKKQDSPLLLALYGSDHKNTNVKYTVKNADINTLLPGDILVKSAASNGHAMVFICKRKNASGSELYTFVECTSDGGILGPGSVKLSEFGSSELSEYNKQIVADYDTRAVNFEVAGVDNKTYESATGDNFDNAEMSGNGMSTGGFTGSLSPLSSSDKYSHKLFNDYLEKGIKQAEAKGKKISDNRKKLLEMALGYLGNGKNLNGSTQYSLGGSVFPPSTSISTDCSGYVLGLYSQFGVSLQRNSAHQYATNGVQVKASIENLVPGDLVFFDHDGDKKIDHVGLYVGNGYMINNTCEAEGVKLNPINDAVGAVHINI